MRTSISTIACLFFCFFHCGELTAQRGNRGKSPAVNDAGGMVVKASVDKDKILIGEPIRLTLECSVPAAASPLVWPAPDSLPHFDWVQRGPVDSLIKPDQRLYRQYITLTSFDSGTFALPRLPFAYADKKAFSDSVRITVDYSKFNPKQDYHDIKEIVDIPNPFAKYIGWLVALFTLLSLTLVVWLVKKRKKLKGPLAVPLPLLSPYEEAMEQLAQLRKQGFAADGTIKVFYTRLNDILRLYIFRKLGVMSMSETNEELIGQLRLLPLDRAAFEELAEALRMSDFVKFAKYLPGIADNERNLEIIQRSVERIHSLGNEGDTVEEKKPSRPGRDNSPVAPSEDTTIKHAKK